jgi:hypothetical protein
MKFLLQKIDGEIRHDFVFTLLEAIRFRNWFNKPEKIIYGFYNTTGNQTEFKFKEIHRKYIPIGSVEFVTSFIYQFYGRIPKPINVPKELFGYAGRDIINGSKMDLFSLTGKFFLKSNDKIKGFSDISNINNVSQIPAGNYQISEYIIIDSEWRAFIYQNKLVGLQNYSGEFTKFPSVNKINAMIKHYKSAPIAYTLDVGVNDNGTFVIEVHDFFSCGLYGFSNYAILPNMYYRWFNEYTRNLK